jgi:sugar phosphate isomerase/epimerase
VRIDRERDIHLTYCTNIHPADGWDAVEANLRKYAPALKARLSPSAPFALGLRLSARDARELLANGRLDELREFLDSEGLYVPLINGFPYGTFHGAVVKADVYAPDWRTDARVEYTNDLVGILARLLPLGIDGGVSTAPLSYKPWMLIADEDAMEAITRNVIRTVEAMILARREHGRIVHLDIEPEPDCLLETSTETIGFFERWLLPLGGRMLAREMGVSLDDAQDLIREHVQVCFDCCHFAVEYEDPDAALDRLREAGIRIGRVQLSSAVDVLLPDRPSEAEAIADRLPPYADTS